MEENLCQIVLFLEETLSVILKEAQQLEHIIKIQISKGKPFSIEGAVLQTKLGSIAIDKLMDLHSEFLLIHKATEGRAPSGPLVKFKVQEILQEVLIQTQGAEP